MNKVVVTQEEALKNYQVYEDPKNHKKYIGIVCGINIEEAEPFRRDFNISIEVVYKSEDEYYQNEMSIKEIFTSGRCRFQEIIAGFDLIDESENKMSVLDINKLIGKICHIGLNKYGEIKSIMLVTYDEENEKHMKIVNTLRKCAAKCHSSMLDEDEIPELVKNYRYIPMTEQGEYFETDFIYHAKISDFEIVQEGNDCNVRVDVKIFNGGKIYDVSAYFNRIYTKGKEKFDDFIIEFGLEDEYGRVNLKKATRLLCAVTLYENSRNKMYVSEIKSLFTPQEQLSQYNYLLEKYFSEK